MQYNNNKSGMSPEKKEIVARIIIAVLVIAVALLVWFVLIPYAKTEANKITTNELVASITLVVTLGTVIYKIVAGVINRGFSAKRRITLDATVSGHFATITCRIENFGKKRIIPQNIYLLIEEGIKNQNGDDYRFPYILKHEKGEYNCAFSNLCQGKSVSSVPAELIPKEFQKSFRQVIKLQHLSSETILYVDPGEEFAEDMTFELKPGVYKATVVWTSVKEDCICSTKEFVVGKTDD